MKRNIRRGRRGATLIEVLIAATLFAVVIMAMMSMIDSNRKVSSTTVNITVVETMAQRMLFRLEEDLAAASGFRPVATVATTLGSGDTGTLSLGTSRGFPPAGMVVIDRGTGSEEFLSYDSLSGNGLDLNTLTRGQQCSSAAAHDVGAEVLWAGLAEPIAQQVTPPASAFDGIALENGADVFFRGSGTGFSYRVPVDPTGGTDYVVDGELTWGASVRGVGQIATGRMALYFQPKTTFDESETGEDINLDDDTDDTFDVGQIRRVTWDTTDPFGSVDDVGMGPSTVIQEACNWGSDLDSNGYEDPLFLWDENTKELHVRIFVLGAGQKNLPIVRQVESVIFLRNEAEI